MTWVCDSRDSLSSVINVIYIHESWHMYECHVIYIHESWRCMSVMSYIYMSHGTCMSESWHAYIQMSHVIYIHESWHIHECHVIYIHESWQMYEWVLTRVGVPHETRMDESRHTYECVMAHVWMRHGTRMKESWNPHIFSMTLPAVMLLFLSYSWTHVWLDSFMCVIHEWHTWLTWLIPAGILLSLSSSQICLYIYNRLLFNIYLHIYHQTFSVILLNISIHL